MEGWREGESKGGSKEERKKKEMKVENYSIQD